MLSQIFMHLCLVNNKDCLLSVCDFIVEFVSTSQMLQDGTTIESLMSRPQSDIHINLPALRKLDAMLLEILDSFEITELWYAEKGSMSNNSTPNPFTILSFQTHHTSARVEASTPS